MRRGFSLWMLLSILGICACGVTPRTEIMVVVEADEGVQLDAESLRFQVWGRKSDVPLFGDPLFDDLFTPATFPRRFGVVPDGDDASRFIRVRATALDARGAEFVTQSAITGFVAGETRLLTLRLSSECRDAMCEEGSNSTCKAGVCENNTVDATLLPAVETADAGSLPDGEVDGPIDMDGAIEDAGEFDAGSDAGGLDAGSDSGADASSDAGGSADSGADAALDSSAGRPDTGTIPDAGFAP